MARSLQSLAFGIEQNESSAYFNACAVTLQTTISSVAPNKNSFPKKKKQHGDILCNWPKLDGAENAYFLKD